MFHGWLAMTTQSAYDLAIQIIFYEWTVTCFLLLLSGSELTSLLNVLCWMGRTSTLCWWCTIITIQCSCSIAAIYIAAFLVDRHVQIVLCYTNSVVTLVDGGHNVRLIEAILVSLESHQNSSIRKSKFSWYRSAPTLQKLGGGRMGSGSVRRLVHRQLYKPFCFLFVCYTWYWWMISSWLSSVSYMRIWLPQATRCQPSSLEFSLVYG